MKNGFLIDGPRIHVCVCVFVCVCDCTTWPPAPGLDSHEVNVDALDARLELREPVQFRFVLPPVVLPAPVVGDLPHLPGNSRVGCLFHTGYVMRTRCVPEQVSHISQEHPETHEVQCTPLSPKQQNVMSFWSTKLMCDGGYS